METAKATIVKQARQWSIICLVWFVSMIAWHLLLVSPFVPFDLKVRRYLGFGAVVVWFATLIAIIVFMSRSFGKTITKFDLFCPCCKLPWVEGDTRMPKLNDVLDWGCCPHCFQPILIDFQGREDARTAVAPITKNG